MLIRFHNVVNAQAVHISTLDESVTTPEAQSAILDVLLPDQDTTVRMWQALLDRSVLVRDVGLAGWLRVTAGTPAETDAFLAAVGEVL